MFTNNRRINSWFRFVERSGCWTRISSISNHLPRIWVRTTVASSAKSSAVNRLESSGVGWIFNLRRTSFNKCSTSRGIVSFANSSWKHRSGHQAVRETRETPTSTGVTGRSGSICRAKSWIDSNRDKHDEYRGQTNGSIHLPAVSSRFSKMVNWLIRFLNDWSNSFWNDEKLRWSFLSNRSKHHL